MVTESFVGGAEGVDSGRQRDRAVARSGWEQVAAVQRVLVLAVQRTRVVTALAKERERCILNSANRGGRHGENQGELSRVEQGGVNGRKGKDAMAVVVR